ncbi:hypothetical protein C3L33_12472, partial [Rhododendron williamsianum]
MAFSSCLLQFHPFTLPHTLSLTPLSLSSKSLKPIYTIPHRELLTSISASTSPSPSLTHKLPPDFSTEQLLHALSQRNDETSALNLFHWASKQPNFKPTLPVYKEIIRKLGHLGSFDSMKRILKDMRVSNCRPDEGTFLIFIESYAKRDLYDDAIGVLDMMEHEFGLKPGRYTFNFLLNVLVDGNKLKLVASVHSMMFARGVEPDVSTFNIVIKALCNSHQIRHAILMIEDLSNYGNDSSSMPTEKVTVNVLIHGYCKEGRIEEALKYAEEMWVEGFRPDQFTFNTLVHGLCKSGHVEHALELLDLMLQEGFDPDVVTYNTLISELCKSGQDDEAMEVLNQMISRDCSPDTVIYNTLLSNLCKEKQMEKAAEFARIITKKGILLDVSTLNSLIEGLCLTKNHKFAIELFHELKNQGCQPDEFTYNMLVDSLCLRGKLDEALCLFKEMETCGFTPNMELQGVSRNKVTYNSLIDGLCMSKRMNEAAELMDQMITEGLQPDKFTYDKMLSHFCRAGNMKKAADIVQTMASNGCELDHLTYGTLIQGFCKARKIKPATRLLRTMQLNGMALTPQIYNPLIEALFKEDIKEAMRLFREMEEKGHPPDAVLYKIVFRGLCSGGGPIGEAVDFLVEMTDNRLTPEFSTFCLLAKGLCVLSMEDTLVMLVERIMKADNFSENEVSVEISQERLLVKVDAGKPGLQDTACIPACF